MKAKSKKTEVQWPGTTALAEQPVEGVVMPPATPEMEPITTNMTKLVQYETARAALAECRDVDEVKNIRDRAEAMRAYAIQARDTDLQNMAAEIRLRAERRVGELLREMKKNEGAKGLGKKVRSSRTSALPPRLSDLGITKDQSSTWQKVAAIPGEKFEASIAQRDRHGELSTASVLRAAKQEPSGSARVGAKAIEPAEREGGSRPARERRGVIPVDESFTVADAMKEFKRQTESLVDDLQRHGGGECGTFKKCAIEWLQSRPWKDRTEEAAQEMATMKKTGTNALITGGAAAHAGKPLLPVAITKHDAAQPVPTEPARPQPKTEQQQEPGAASSAVG